MRSQRAVSVAALIAMTTAAIAVGALSVTLPNDVVLVGVAAALGLMCVSRPETLLLACVAMTVVVNAEYATSLGSVRFLLLVLLLVVLIARSRGSTVTATPGLTAGVVVAGVVLLATSAQRFTFDEGVQRAMGMVVILLVVFFLPRARALEDLTWFWERVFQLLLAFLVIGTVLRAAISPGDIELRDALRGPFTNPNALGLVSGACIVWLVTRERRALTFIFVPILGAFLLASQSRGALIGVIIATVGIGTAKRRALSLVVLAVGLFTVASPASFIAGLEGNERIGAWRAAMSAAATTPLSGPGFGRTEDAIASGDLSVPLDFQGQHLHNSYLEVVYELGIIPGLIFLCGIAAILIASLRRKPTDRRLAFLRPLLLFSLISAFAESWLFSTGSIFGLAFWIGVGTLWARSRSPAETIRPVANELQPTGGGK